MENLAAAKSNLIYQKILPSPGSNVYQKDIFTRQLQFITEVVVGRSERESNPRRALLIATSQSLPLDDLTADWLVGGRRPKWHIISTQTIAQLVVMHLGILGSLIEP